MRVETMELRVEHGFLWIPWRAPTAPIPWFSELGPELAYASRTYRWNTHFSRSVESQLDYAHLPFVHANTIGRGFDPAIDARFEVTATGI